MANPTHIQLNQVARSFTDADDAAQSFSKTLKLNLTTNKTFVGSIVSTTKELVGLRSVFSGLKTAAFGFLGASAWRQGFETMGRLEKMSIQTSMAVGQMDNISGIMKEITQLSGNLGVEWEQMASAFAAAGKHRAQMHMTNKEFINLVKSASEFGEAVGIGAEQGAALAGKLSGVARLSNKQIKMIQNEFVHLQRTIGLASEEIIAMGEGLVPVIQQIKILGATESDIKGLVKATGDLVLGFAAVGKTAGEATEFIDRLMDPGRIQENIVLYSQLGLSMSDALDAIEGKDPGAFIERVQDQLPELAKRIKSMGAIAGEQFSRNLGLSFREVIKFSEMSSEDAKKRAKDLETERKNEQAFQKQLQQTLRTWQRYFIGLTQAFDSLAMRFSSVLGGENFKNWQNAILKIAHTVIDILESAQIAKLIKMSLDFIDKIINVIRRVVLPIADSIGKAVNKVNMDKIIDQIGKIAEMVGNTIGILIEKYLPPFLDGIAKFVNWLSKMSDMLGPKGTLATGLALFATGKFLKGAATGEGFGGAILGPILSQLTGGLLGSKAGLSPMNPLYVTDADKAKLSFFKFAKNLTNPRWWKVIFGKFGGGGITSGIMRGGAGIYGAYSLLSNISDAKEKGRDSGFAFIEGIVETTKSPTSMAAIGYAMAGPKGAIVGALVGMGTSIGKTIGDSFKTSEVKKHLDMAEYESINWKNRLGVIFSNITAGIIGASKITEQNANKLLTESDKFIEDYATKRKRFNFQLQEQFGSVKQVADVGGTGKTFNRLQAFDPKTVAETFKNLQKEGGIPKEISSLLSDNSTKEERKSLIKLSSDMEELVTKRADIEKQMRQNRAGGIYGGKHDPQKAKQLIADMEKVDTAMVNLAKTFRSKMIDKAVRDNIAKPFEDARASIAEQFKKGLINADQAREALEGMNKTIESMSKEIKNDILKAATDMSLSGSLMSGNIRQFGKQILKAAKNMIEKVTKPEEFKLRQKAEDIQKSALNQLLGDKEFLMRLGATGDLGAMKQMVIQAAQQRAIAESGRVTGGADMQKFFADSEWVKDIGDMVETQEYNIKSLIELAKQSNLNLEEMKKYSKQTAGHGAGALEQLKDINENTRPKTKRFIDLDAIAVRANESRNVTLMYQSTPYGV